MSLFRPVSLLELNRIIRQTLDAHLEPSYWVVAEIGEMRLAQRGHCYLELVEKEDEEVKARIRGNIWAYSYRTIAGTFLRVTGQELAAGMKVLVNAQVQYHELYGMSLNIRDIDPNYTLGERARKRQEVIQQLREDGVYTMNKGLELPLVPQRLAVISSPTAAGFGDFTDQLSQNPWGYRFNIRLFRTVMQGDSAKASIVGSLHEIFSRMDAFDVVCIIRGGGSQVDLDCFDTYDVASHIAQFPLPVITGIGHERDETVADLVAHTQMKTPTAVAEFLLSGMRRFEDRLDEVFNRIGKSALQYLRQEDARLNRTRDKLHHQARSYLDMAKQHLAFKARQMAYAARRITEEQRVQLEQRATVLKRIPFRIVAAENERLEALARTLRQMDPQTILKKGYTLTTLHGVRVTKDQLPEAGATLITRGAGFTITSTARQAESNRTTDEK